MPTINLTDDELAAVTAAIRRVGPENKLAPLTLRQHDATCV